MNKTDANWLYKSAKLYQTIAILGLNTLLFVIVAEVLAYAYLSTVTEPFRDPRRDLSYYVQQDWSEQYWQEFRAIRRSYHPFILWRRNQFSGQFINIDENGLRIVPQSNCHSDHPILFMFGGSTMWGTGAQDDATIPSYLAEEIDKYFQAPVCIINFGESAYTSTQSLIALIAELHRGNIPDYVIFYDGVNDSHAVFTSAKQWTHANLPNIAKRFDPPDPPLRQLIRKVNLYKIAQRIRSQNAEKTIPSFEKDLFTLSDYVSSTYIENYRIVETLSSTYGFEFAFFWQPVLGYDQKMLTPEEANMLDETNRVEISLNGKIYNRLAFINAAYDHTLPQLENLPHANNLSLALADQHELLYIDFVHVTPEANQLVAAEMFQRLQSSLAKHFTNTP